MKFRTLAIAATAVFLPLSVAACGDDSTGDLKVSDMSKELQDSGMTKETADCMAQKLKDADFSEDDLKDITNDPSSEKGKKWIESAKDCVTDAIPTSAP